MGGAVGIGHTAGDACVRRGVDKRGECSKAFSDNFRITGDSENPGQVLKFAAQVRVVIVGDDAVESSHVAAELAGGYAHLVHRIPLVAAHGRVHRHHPVSVGGQRLQHRRSWGALVAFLHRRRGGSVVDGIPKRRR